MQVGDKIGPYEIIRELGRGGMGVVFLAHDTQLEREVAIKVIPDAMAHDEERSLRFEREAKLLASLNHTNIAQIYGIEVSNNKKTLVLEYVEGETLAARLKRGPLDVDETLNVARQIAEALEVAHERGVIHRDLKPGNVMIRSDGVVKVLDFGLARAISDETGSNLPCESPTITAGYTRPGIVLGTAAYMSPEQARGKPMDKRTDIWSFGVVLLECLTAQTPFRGETISDSIGAILHKQPDWTLLPSDTPPTIHLLLRRCLTKDATKRLRDIGDARIEIENAIADPTSSSLGLAVSALTRESSKRGSSVTRSLAVTATLLIVAVLSFVFGRQLTDKPSTVVRKYEISLHDEDSWNAGQPSISPDGTMVAYVDQEKIWIRYLNSWDAREVEESHRGVIPFWSPDNQWLGFGRQDELVKVHATGGRPVVITKAPGVFSLVGSGAWSDTGKIFYSTGDTGILTVSADGGVSKVYVANDHPDDDDFHEMALLPDGKTVIFSVHSRSRPWYLGLYDGHERKEILAFNDHHITMPVYSPTGHLLFQRMSDETSLWAIPFSTDRLEVTGSPFQLSPNNGDPTISQNGTLVMTMGIGAYFGGELVKVKLNSNEIEPFANPGGVFFGHAISPDRKSIAVSGFDLNAVDV